MTKTTFTQRMLYLMRKDIARLSTSKSNQQMVAAFNALVEKHGGVAPVEAGK